MEKQIKYSDISLICKELLRKNNDTFMRSRLSPIMGKIFMAANAKYDIVNYENEYYMKSGILHNRVFYIYSDELTEKAPEKIFDVVDFNGEICIWFYSNNVINMIEKDPVNTVYDMYKAIATHLRYQSKYVINNFAITEQNMACRAMVLGFVKFLHETYGVIDVKESVEKFKKYYDLYYTPESIKEFIDDVFDNCDSKDYYDSRKYLDSHLLLKVPTDGKS